MIGYSSTFALDCKDIPHFKSKN